MHERRAAAEKKVDEAQKRVAAADQQYKKNPTEKQKNIYLGFMDRLGDLKARLDEVRENFDRWDNYFGKKQKQPVSFGADLVFTS